MGLEDIGINAGNWVDSAQDMDLLKCPCECGIGSPGSTSHGVSYNFKIVQHSFPQLKEKFLSELKSSTPISSLSC